MTTGTLSTLQVQILEVLSTIQPPWTLTGGAALAGFYLQHRTTKDLDLFWHGREQLHTLPELVHSHLSQQGWDVERLQTAASFCRLRVANFEEVVLVDLVAESVSCIEETQHVSLGQVQIQIDSYYEILVNKFCALLSRSELRDLQDVHQLLANAQQYDLSQILRDAAKKDGGFSPLVLAWTLRDFPIAVIAQSMSWPEEQTAALVAYRDKLMQELLTLSNPGH